MQIRRVLLLFALVLGLSALVASIAPPPEESDEEPAPRTATARTPAPAAPAGPLHVTLRSGTRRVPLDSSFTLEVPVQEPGEVVLRGLGFRQSADPRAPARFDLLASPAGRYAVAFAPPLQPQRVIGHLAFVEPSTVTRARRDR